MQRRDRIDALGAIALAGFSLLLAFNQVVIKVVNAGLQPAFSAGLRSAGAFVFLLIVFGVLRRPFGAPRHTWPGLALVGLFFTVEFLLLFIALDLTDVSRVSIIFYSMPIWMSLGAHYLIPGERMSRAKAVGLAVAMAGVAWAILDRAGAPTRAGLVGDLCALASAIFWAAIGLTLRVSRASEAPAYVQLMAQLLISGVVLIAVAPLFGPVVRSPDAVTWAGLGFQIVVVASGGFLFWIFLLKIYPASGVASFSFLAPVFGVFLGWAMLDETLTATTFGALALVAVGLVLINVRRGPRAG